jgi:K+-sensing histidine kinase KdpD
VKLAEAHVDALSTKLDKAREELAIVREQFASQMARADELSTALSHADREAQEATRRATDLAAQLADASQSNMDVNRRLQELEARRALEIAEGQGRADLDELLQVTQERLAGQTEKLIHAEGRVHELEREIAATAERTEEIEAELRQQHMAEAIRQIRGEGHEQPHVVPDDGSNDDVDGPLEDRRSGTPFRTELSRDARKSLSQILGLAQILKHQKDAKEQAQLIKQLTSYARRLDHTVSDLVDADQLARGTVELNVKRTDLQALVMRVVEESGVGNDHEVRIDAEPLLVGIDQRRTEQILSGLLRSSGDRTPRGKGITIKMTHVDGGAMLFVEDPEPSSDASMSPVVRRFAEVQGGWARVESREGGGSSFRVFLPDGGPNATPSDVDDDSADAASMDVEDMADLPVVVDEPWDPSAEQVLIQELHRLSELNADD